MATEKKRIEELTPEQDTQLEVYYKKWLAIGMATGPSDREEAKKGVELAYKAAGLKMPEIQFYRSPVEAKKAAAALGVSVGSSDFGYGHHDANWLAFYEFFREVLGMKEETEELAGLFILARHSGWWLPFENVCFICDRPEYVHVDTDGSLHKDGGPAMRYSDGVEFWYLHGVEVPSWIVTTPAEQLDAAKIMGLENVDQRREGVRKCGLERMLKALNAHSVDKWSYMTADGKEHPYELFELKLPGAERVSKALKMTNPSLGVFHVEFVWPGVANCKEALAWRNTASQDKKVLEKWVPPPVLT